MAHLVGDLAKYFQIDEINIDNWYFKLFYKGCTLVYFIGSMVGLLSQYFGDPINCDFSGVDVSTPPSIGMIDQSGLQTGNCFSRNWRATTAGYTARVTYPGSTRRT